jgi:hypothetical protein
MDIHITYCVPLHILRQDNPSMKRNRLIGLAPNKAIFSGKYGLHPIHFLGGRQYIKGQKNEGILNQPSAYSLFSESSLNSFGHNHNPVLPLFPYIPRLLPLTSEQNARLSTPPIMNQFPHAIMKKGWGKNSHFLQPSHRLALRPQTRNIYLAFWAASTKRLHLS